MPGERWACTPKHLLDIVDSTEQCLKLFGEQASFFLPAVSIVACLALFRVGVKSLRLRSGFPFLRTEADWGFFGTGTTLFRLLNYSTVFYPPDASSTLPPVMTIKMSLDIAKCPLGATPAHSRKLDTNLRPVAARRPVGGRVTPHPPPSP